MSWPWSELGLSGPAALHEVRRAYAERLKQTHPEEDPEGFQRLHEAYEQARRISRQQGRGNRQEPADLSAFTPAAKTEEKAPENPQKKLEGWDFDALTEPPAAVHTQEPEEDRQDWDYTALLEEEQAQKTQTEAQNERETWDFDALIEPPPPVHPTEPKENKQSWDYARLFEEEEQRQTEERQRRYAAREDGEDWQAVDAAMQIVYRLFVERRPLSDWMQFLHTGVFFRVKGNLMFLSELAEFFKENFSIDQGVKHAFLNVYGLNEQMIPAIYCPLYEALTGEHKKSTEEIKKKKIRTLVMVWTAILGILLIPPFSNVLSEFKLERTYETLSTYIEEDFGCAVTAEDKNDKEKKKFSLVDDPNLRFLVWLDGSRNPKNGELGYGTNFGDARTRQKLEVFAKEWGYPLHEITENYDSAEKAAFHGVMPTKYYLELPLSGAGDCITALGKLLEDIKQEPWFEIVPPSFELYLSFETVSYYKCKWPAEAFGTEKVRTQYETQVPFQLGMYMIKESGLGEAEFGSKDYIMADFGTIERNGQLYYLIAGAKSETDPIRYLYLYNGKYLYSVKAEEFDQEMEKFDEYKFLMGDSFISKSKTISRSLQIYQLSNEGE